MTRRRATERWFQFIPALALALRFTWTAALHADQAQYFYDELGRLVGGKDM